MTTTEIKGFFSKEHSILVFLICFCFVWLYKTDRTLQTILLQQAEIKADIKIITYRLNNGIGKESEKQQLASFNIYGCERESKFQTTNPLFACFLNNRERIAKGKYRIY